MDKTTSNLDFDEGSYLGIVEISRSNNITASIGFDYAITRTQPRINQDPKIAIQALYSTAIEGHASFHKGGLESQKIHRPRYLTKINGEVCLIKISMKKTYKEYTRSNQNLFKQFFYKINQNNLLPLVHFCLS